MLNTALDTKDRAMARRTLAGLPPPPPRPKPPQDHPEQLVRSGKPRLPVLPAQNGELPPQGQIFQKEIVSGPERTNQQEEYELQRTEHKPVVAENASDPLF